MQHVLITPGGCNIGAMPSTLWQTRASNLALIILIEWMSTWRSSAVKRKDWAPGVNIAHRTYRGTEARADLALNDHRTGPRSEPLPTVRRSSIEYIWGEYLACFVLYLRPCPCRGE